LLGPTQNIIGSTKSNAQDVTRANVGNVKQFPTILVRIVKNFTWKQIKCTFTLKAVRLCRYCESLIPIADINVNLPEAQRNICKKAECSNKIKTVCSKLLSCKHPCFGFANEMECPPCLENKCCLG